jgi:hypothetical protein
MFPVFCSFLTGNIPAETEENLLTGYPVDRERKYRCAPVFTDLIDPNL